MYLKYVEQLRLDGLSRLTLRLCCSKHFRDSLLWPLLINHDLWRSVSTSVGSFREKLLQGEGDLVNVCFRCEGYRVKSNDFYGESLQQSDK